MFVFLLWTWSMFHMCGSHPSLCFDKLVVPFTTESEDSALSPSAQSWVPRFDCEVLKLHGFHLHVCLHYQVMSSGLITPINATGHFICKEDGC